MPPVVSGWPDNEAFRAFLGLQPDDPFDLAATDAALAAAIGDAIRQGVAPVDPILTDTQRQALFSLGGLWLMARNRPDTWQFRSATEAERRVMLGVLRGSPVVAV